LGYDTKKLLRGEMGQKTILITGSSSGIGFECAKLFLAKGFRVICVSRRETNIEGVVNICGDITDTVFLDELKIRLEDEIKHVDILLNNAGIGMYGAWEDAKIEEIRKLFELNFFAVINTTNILLPFLKESKGVVMNLSSVAGKIYTPYMGAYSASKFALSAFSDTLRVELKKYDVKVCDLIVGRIGTGFSDRALGIKDTPKTPFIEKAENLAQVIYKAYESGSRSLVFPAWYRLFIFISKLLPQSYDNISAKKWREILE